MTGDNCKNENMYFIMKLNDWTNAMQFMELVHENIGSFQENGSLIISSICKKGLHFYVVNHVFE